MTPDQKLLTAQSLLPVLADFLEDYPCFKREFKQEATKLISQIRYFDKMFMDTAEEESVNEQNNIQLWFRQQLEEALNQNNK
jgi:hypothetical protein